MLPATSLSLKPEIIGRLSCSACSTCSYTLSRTLHSYLRASYALARNLATMAPRNKGKIKSHQKQSARRPTHFVCFPLVTNQSVQQLKQSLAKFKEVTMPRDKNVDTVQNTEVGPELTTSSSLRLLPAAAHRPPGTFHFTLGTMDLSEDADMERALRLLQEIDYSALYSQTVAALSARGVQGDRSRHNKVDVVGEASNTDLSTASTTTTTTTSVSILSSLTRDISPPRRALFTSQDSHLSPQAQPPSQSLHPLQITLHSLGTFPTSRSARVFYAEPAEPTGVLQGFGELIRKVFKDEGLITETRPLVLHATVANLIYVKGRGKGKGKSSDGGNVDAREILDLFNHNSQNASSLGLDLGSPFIWASDIPIDRIRICKMGAEKSDNPDWGLEYRPIGEKVFVS
ncbi:hypothetical protein PV10_03232 [Exophiala mesophila]|uniref:A-kinase anchor protein 7-like phosphoesterase domain-containing protein n=1 Tax=Exophiala mesophila TaxID=212818 RepID=A0A0D1Y4L8_EXOME|nr:uncharacterized protein PV10_03232 [Exophiala mesophila]KIV95601.1 hypothetical protein PV10_03232 [Exophiala mesophila]